MLNRFFSANLIANSEITGSHLWIAVAVLACLLGAEIACIWILCSKVKKAHADKLRHENGAGSDNNFHSYGLTGVMMLGAASQTPYIALLVLSALCALAALVFAVLMIVFRVKGYDYVSVHRLEEEAEQSKQSERAEVPSAPEEAPQSTPSAEECEPLRAFDDSEEQRQDAYVCDEEAVFDEEAEPEEESVVTETNAEEETSGKTEPTERFVAAVEQQPMASTYGAPVFADGSKPYKVVEKTVTETYKEVVKETQTPTPAAQNGGTGNAATDAILEKLTDLLDLELQKRKGDQSDGDDKDKSVSTMAHADEAEAFSEDDEEEDEDELDDAEDAEDAEEATDEDDADDEASDGEDRFTGNERIIGFDEETGCYIVAHYRKSFEAKLIQSRPNIKHYYSELKNALLSYKGTKSRISWNADSFHNGRTPIAKINVKTRILELYLALEPESLDGTVYRGQNVGDKKKYADTPFRYKIRTPRKFNWAMELVQRTCEEHGLSPIDIEKIAYEEQYPFDTTDNLVQRKLIKEYIREEKPATSFELAPDHVTQVPEEDSSVIPANANFSWEFDNDMLREQEEEPVSEPVTEETEPAAEEDPAVQEEPAQEPVPTAAATTVLEKETVKVTEVHYTERYYADAAPVYEQYITSTEPIEAEAIPADAEVQTAEPEETSAEETPRAESDEDEHEEPAEYEEHLSEESEDAAEAYASFGDADPFAAYREEDEKFSETEESFEDDAGDVTAESASYNVEEDAYWTDGEDRDVFEEESEGFDEKDDGGEAEAAEASDGEEPEPAFDEEDEEPQAPSEAPTIPANPSVAVVDISAVEQYFDEGDTVSLETLNEKGLVLPTATVLKLYASGDVTKRLAVEAHHFTLDAIKAISDADGDTVMIR